MLKIRLMGTQDDINWFKKFLKNNSEIETLESSDLYLNKGTNNYFRSYIEIQKTKINKTQ